MQDDRISRWTKEIRVLDGGFGSECQKFSSVQIDGHRAWSCRLLKEDPNLVCKVHKSYLKAGADVISTNTYQASPQFLAEALQISRPEAIELMKHAVRLARRAIEQLNTEDPSIFARRKLPVLVAGSLGPYGACIADGSEYTGSYADKMSYDDLVNFHLERAKILLDSGVDLIAWETIPILNEVAAICEVMRRLPGALGWVSVASADGQTTVGGDSLRQIALEVDTCDQVFGIGVNCSISHDAIGQALANLTSLHDPCTPGNEEGFHPPNTCLQISDTEHNKPRKILILYANSGEMWIKSRQQGHWVWPPDKGPSSWVQNIAKWSKRRTLTSSNLESVTGSGSSLGTSVPPTNSKSILPLAQWVGGCCRVGPEQIRQLAELIKPDEHVTTFVQSKNKSSSTTVSLTESLKIYRNRKRKLPTTSRKQHSKRRST